MTRCLLETGKHTITALTRADSKSSLPSNVIAKQIDYDDHESIVSALRGQDALVITMSAFAPPGQQEKLIKAAADADVPWILPNDWSPDTQHEGLLRDVYPLFHVPEAKKKIEELGKSHWIGVTTGFWYEWSLAIPAAFGIDLRGREAMLFDDGTTKMTISTWPQVGRAVAALLSLPIEAADGGSSERCLAHFRNKNIYVGSFTVSQKEMLKSALRVTDTKLEDWKVSYEPAVERYETAKVDMKNGDRMAFARQMYTRVFYPDDSGNFEKRVGLQNEMLGLPKEDMDEATRAAVKRQLESNWG